MLKPLLFVLAFALAANAHAQSLQTSGAIVVIAGTGEVTRANDEARATFMVEEQDKDKAAAASRANAKMKQGMEILKREDPRAKLETRGYYTTPVYADADPRQPVRQRPIVGWRVGQFVELTTGNLEGLPRTVAAAQRVLALNGLHFGLAPETLRQLDRERIAAAYRNLTERIAAILTAMGRTTGDAVIESVDFEGTDQGPAPRPMRAAMASAPAQPQVEEPSFEPGETTLQMRVVGRVKLR